MLVKHKAAEIGCPRPVLRKVVVQAAGGHGTADIADELDYSAERVRQIKEGLREMSPKDRALLLCDVADKNIARFFDRVCDPRDQGGR